MQRDARQDVGTGRARLRGVSGVAHVPDLAKHFWNQKDMKQFTQCSSKTSRTSLDVTIADAHANACSADALHIGLTFSITPKVTDQQSTATH
jgi:hypothetical protein